MLQNILNQLSKVRRTGDKSWMACCPAHDDRSPSLSIKDTGDKILLRCFAGCETESVVGSIGLTMSDLFSDPLSDSRRERYRKAYTKNQIEHERLVLAIAEHDRARGKRLSNDDLAREREAWLIVNGGSAT